MRKNLAGSVIEAEVLTRSRRRCAICFGLSRDTSIVQGQIAHLDGDRNNNDLGNLAFLCFNHHDQFDGTTSQSKGLKVKEVKQYRDELYEELGQVLRQEVHFGSIEVDKNDPFAGNYTRLGTGMDSAELILTPLPDNLDGFPRYFVSGLALAGSYREFGPNTGELECVVEYAKLDDRTVGRFYSESHSITLRHDGDILLLHEEFDMPPYGMGVTFQGTYRRR